MITSPAKHLPSLFLALLLCVLYLPAPAQQISYTNFTTRDGLVSNIIYDMIEDRDGFIWIATDRGVSRYDGISFTNFNSENGLQDNDVVNLYEDSAGRIWFMCFSKKPCYYYNGKVFNETNDPFLKAIRNTHNNSLYNYTLDLDHRIFYFTTQQGNKNYLVSKDRQDSLYTGIFEGDKTLSPTLIVQRENHLNCVVSFTGYQLFLDRDSSYKQVPSFSFNKKLSGIDYQTRRVLFTANSSGKTGWINLSSLDTHYLPIAPFPLRVHFDAYSNTIYGLYKDSIVLYNKEGIRLSAIPMRANTRNIFVDHAGNIWLGSADGGIILIRRNASFRLGNHSNSGLEVSSMVIYRDELLAGTMARGVLKAISGQLLDSSMAKDRIVSMLVSGRKLFIATDLGFLEYTPGKPAQRISKLAGKDLETVSDSVLLLAVSSGIYLVNTEHPDMERRIYFHRVTSVAPKGPDEYWAGTLDGLVVIRKKGNDFVSEKLITHTLLDESHINDIKRDKYGNSWIATAQHGVFRFSETSLEHFSDDERNPGHFILSNVCRSIFIDSLGIIRICHLKGLSEITGIMKENLRTFRTKNYTLAEGLPELMINSVVFYKNQMVIATPSGCYQVKPQVAPAFNSRVIITSIRVNDQEQEPGFSTLTHSQNNLVFNFSAAFINSPTGKYRFRYRIPELNENWIYINSFQVPLLGLAPGQYTLDIAALDKDGKSGPLTSYRFSITPPWYKHPLFILLVLLLAAGMLIYLLKREKNRIELSRNLAQMELKVLRAQMNPHFIFNSLNAIQRFLFNKDFEVVNQYINNFAKLIRSSLRFTRVEMISLEDERNFLLNYLELEKMRFEDLFNYEIDIDPRLETYETLLPSFMIQPLVENSIKHGFKQIKSGGMVHICIDLLAPQLVRVSVSDNGQGFPEKFPEQDESSASVGLSIVIQRIGLLRERFNSDTINFSISNNTNAAGTTAILVLPISEP